MRDPRCGTHKGFFAHKHRNEKPCDPCRLAENERRRAKGRVMVRKPLDRSKCGTSANYEGHRRRGERACDPCRQAHNADSREYRRQNRGPSRRRWGSFDPNRCGTPANYRLHHYYKVPPCEACLRAYREYQRYRKPSRAKVVQQQRQRLVIPSFLFEEVA